MRLVVLALFLVVALGSRVRRLLEPSTLIESTYTEEEAKMIEEIWKEQAKTFVVESPGWRFSDTVDWARRRRTLGYL